MIYWKTIILLILVIFTFLNIRYNNKVNNELNILQLTNPHKQLLEENISQLSPSIITDAIEQYPDIDNINIHSLTKSNINKNIKIYKIMNNKQKEIIYTPTNTFLNWIIKNNIKEPNENFSLEDDSNFLTEFKLYNKFNEFANYYLPPFTASKKYLVSIGNKYIKSDIERVNNGRLIICQIEGSRRYYLFNPEQSKFLYKSNNYNNGKTLSQINFWNQDHKKYPDFEKSQYMEIIIRKGQMLYIPKYWWYCSENSDISITIKMESMYFTDIVNKSPTILSYIGNKIGLVQ